jgi:hypothetical protein
MHLASLYSLQCNDGIGRKKLQVEACECECDWECFAAGVVSPDPAPLLVPIILSTIAITESSRAFIDNT